MSTKRYRVGEKVYNIPLDKVSPFKQVYPNAVEENDNESGNSNDVVVEDAIATSDQDTASTLDDGSSDSQQVEMGPPEFDNETLFLNLEDQIDNKDQKKEFTSEVNIPNVTIEAPKDELFFDVSDVIGKSEQDIVRRLEEISNKNEKYQGYEFSSTVFDFTPQVKIKNKETGEQTKVFLNKKDFTSTLAGISDFVLGDNSVKDNALIQKSINSVFNLYKNEDETIEEFVDRATPTVKAVSYSDRKPMQRTPTTTQYQIDAYLSRKDKVTSIGNINKLEGSDGEIIYYRGSDIRLKASKEEIQQFEALAYHNKFHAQSMAVKNEMLSEDLQNASLVTLTSVLAGTEDDVAFTEDVKVDFDKKEFARDDVQQNDYSYLDHQIYISERIVSDFTKSFIETESILMSEYEAGYKVEQGKYKKQITNALNKAFESELSYYDQQRQSQIEIIKDQELSFIRREIDAGIYEGYSEDQLNDILNQRISKKYDAFNDSLTKTDRFKAFQKEYEQAYNDELLDLTSEWRESQLEIIQKSYDNAFEKYKENYKPSFDKIDQQELQNIAYALDTKHNFRDLSYLEQVHLIDSYWNGMSALLAEDPAINGQEEIDEIKREYYGYFYETELSNAKKRGQQSNFIRKSMVREFYQSSKIQLDKLVDEYMLANPYESYLQKSKEANATPVSEEKYRSAAFDHITRSNRTLVKAIKNSADILNSDDPQELMQNSEIKNFWLGLTSGSFSEAVPFLSGVLDLGETYDLYKISRVPEAERTQIQNMYVALNAIESQHQEALKKVSENFAVGQSVKQSIPFFLEIAITGGAYTVAKNSTVKGIKSGLLKGSKGRFKKGTDDLLFVKKGTEYKIVDNASEVLGVINGSIAQTMVNPQRWLDATYKNLTPTMSFMLTEEAEPLLGKLGLTTFTPEGGEAKDDSILKAWLRGTGTTWSSYVTERSGLYYGRAASRLGRPINAQWQKAVNNNDFLRRLTGGWIMTKYGNASNFLQRNIGLDGFFGEFLEEIQEMPMSNIINGDITLQGIYKYDELGNRLGLDVENLRFTAKSVGYSQLLFKGGGFALNSGYSLTQRNKKITYEIEGTKFKDEEDFNSALFSLEENGLLTDETKITIKNDFSAVDNTIEVLERNGVSTDIIDTGPTKLGEGDYVTANEVEIMNEIQDGDHGGKTAKEIREELVEKEKEIVKLRSEITSIDNSDAPKDQKNKDKSRLKQKVRNVTVQINNILKKAKDRANVKKREPIYQRALAKIKNLLPSDTKIVEFNTAEELGNKYIKDKHNASRTVDQAPSLTAGKATYINNADNTEITDPELIKQIEADYNEAVNSGQGAFNSVNNEILINKEKALLGGNVNVTAHEFLHRMLKTSLENNPELKIAFGEALYSHLRTLNPKGIRDKNFRGRLAAYNKKSKAEQMEEVMTLFSDAIVNGTMTYDATFAEKIGDIIRRIMQSLGVQITFEKPEDVFNFIRDYNKSIAKGELTRSQKQLLSGEQTIQAGGQIQAYADQQKKEIKKISKKTGLSTEQLDQAGLRFSKEISPKGKEYIEFGFDNKSLVDIINSKSSSAEERFGAVDALVEKNWPVISSAIKFNPTGEISMDAIKEAISEQILGIFPEVTLQDGRKVKREGKRLLDTYNKTTEVTTFLSSTLRPRTAEILARGKQIDAATRGVSLDEAKGIEDGSAQPLADENSTYEKSKPKINILKDFAGVPESDIISLVKPAEGDKFKQIISKYAGKTGELVFGVPAKKIMEGGANLTPTIKIQEGMVVPSEALQIQSFFRKQQNLENFVKTLPLYNVTEMTADINRQGESIDVSRDTYGIAIGLRGLPLDYFYESFTDPRSKSDDIKVRAKSITSPKGRSKGLTTQTDVKKLKQKFRKPTKEVLNQLRKDLGITPAKQRNEYTRDIGQLLKGVAKVYSINASLSGAQRNQEAKLETAKPKDAEAIKQQTADITAAQSKIAFSKSVADGMSKIMFSNDINSKSKESGDVNLNKFEGKQKQKDWLINFGFATLPKSFWINNGQLIGAGAKYTKQLEQNLIDLAGELDYYEDFDPITRVELNLGAVIEAIQDGDARAKKRLSTFKESVNDLLKKGKLPRGLKPLLIKASKIETVKKYELKDGERVAARKMLFANVGQLNDFINEYEKNGGKFAPESSNVEALVKRTTLYGKKTAKQVRDQINKNQDLYNNSEKGFIDTWLVIQQDIKNNPNNMKHWAALLEVTSTSQANWMRVASRLIGSNTLGLKNVEEHMSPATDFAQYLWVMAKDGLLSPSVIKKAMKSFTQISLPEVYDKLLKGEGFDYTKNLPGKDFGFDKNLKLEIFTGMMPSWVRYINPQVNAQVHTINGVEYKGMNPNVLILADGKNLAQTYGLGVDSSLEMNQDVISVQQELLFKVFTNNITKAEAVSQLNDYVNNMIPAASSISMFSKDIDANKANVNPKGITILDFDDTLATTKSGVRYTMPNPSGKPQPRRKAILIAGNAGAGKTTVISQLGLRKQGFKYVNQDVALDWLTKNNGLPKDMNEFTRKQAEKWRELGGQAAVAAKNKASKLRGQGDGVVIDGTGAVGVQFQDMARKFKDAGYDVQIIFVESSLETALERNANRSERRLTDATVRNAYEATQKNKKAFKEMVSFFPYSAKGFIEVNTDNLKQGGSLPSNLVETMDNFTKGYIKGRLNAEEFASQGQTLLGEGAEFDFSEFNKVVEGKTAPLFNKAMKLQGKFGPENMFVLTARPAEAQGPIFDFLKANGLNIPLKNITGLGNSTAEAKALWVAGKFSEGYNDFYFADDAIQNVKAVDNILEQFDVKRKVQQAKINFSKDLDPKFNQILERSAGVGAQKIFSRVEAAKRGKNKGRFTFFVPPSAEDFTGLLRYFAGTGKQGDADIQFFNEALVKPFARADRAMSQMKQTIRDDYSALRKKFPEVKKKLGKLIEGTTFTNDMAIRVYLFDKAGYETSGLSKQGKAKLLLTVKTDPEMRAFADALGIISKQKDGYLKPGEYWNTENIALDLQNATNKVGRKQFLQEWVQNKEIIFSPANMNKIEAVYGTQFREALEDVLYRMENGTNRSKGKNYGQGWTNWVNNSVGAIMFFNARSAVLQTLSTVNFINFEDNNIFAAGKAFANQKQYWSDFSFLFNSDFLRNRRAGLATNVNEAELASAVAGATNKAKAALGYLLKIGFTPTQIADSFAIASGGATYYRNRINTYLKSGMSQSQAESRAMLDFQEIAEETQQSARPDRISQQQASNLGRIILAFANTPMQYNRLIKKAAGDLVNRRGDWKANVSRILYYGAIQNFIFASLQNALFALAFDEDDEELTESQQAARDRKEDTKNSRILNSMFDSLARGSGVYGAALATIKNAILEFYEQDAKGFRADYNQVAIELLNVSPPLGSKVRKLASAGYTRKVQKDVMQEMSMLDYDNPAWQSIGNVVEATTNIPMARAIRKADNLREAFNQENSAMQRVFLALGWSAWDLGVGTEVVKNEGKKNEYVVTLDTKRMKQYEVEKKIDERKTEERKEEAKKNKLKKKEKEAKKNQREVEANIEKQKEEGEDATCAAISSKGNRCKRKVVDGKSFCTVHEKVEKSESGEMKQCKKIKSDGNRCGIKTNSKSGLCYYHD